MAKAYTPGLKVSARTTHRSRRLLPITGEVRRSRSGDAVVRRQGRGRGDLHGGRRHVPMNVANRLELLARRCRPNSCFPPKEIGETVAQGGCRLRARSKGIFGMPQVGGSGGSRPGRSSQISTATGQLMIRGSDDPGAGSKAYHERARSWKCCRSEGCVIENDVLMVQGIFGVGGETEGEIHDRLQRSTIRRSTPDAGHART